MPSAGNDESASADNGGERPTDGTQGAAPPVPEATGAGDPSGAPTAVEAQPRPPSTGVLTAQARVARLQKVGDRMGCGGFALGTLAIICVCWATGLTWWHGLLLWAVLMFTCVRLIHPIAARRLLRQAPKGSRERHEFLQALRLRHRERKESREGTPFLDVDLLRVLLGEPCKEDEMDAALNAAIADAWRPEHELPRPGEERERESLRRLLVGQPQVRLLAAARLAEMGESQWRDLVRGDEDDLTRILESGNPDAPAILACVFADGTPEDQERLVAAASCPARPGSIGLLLTALRHGHAAARESAAQALAANAGAEVVPALLKQLSENQNPVDAIRALAQIGDPRAVPSVVEFLGKASASGAVAACQALAELGDPSATDGLVGILLRTDSDWAEADPTLDMLLNTDMLLVGAIAAGFAEKSGADPTGASRAATALGGWARREVAAATAAAARALRRLCDREALSAVIDRLRAASQERGNAPGTDAVEGIVQLLTDDHGASPSGSSSALDEPDGASEEKREEH